MFSFFKRKPVPPKPPDPLDRILFGFAPNDPFTVRDACEGIQIFGGIGSGKTSGSGDLVARAFLQAGLGGVVLTAKPDETDRWIKLAQQAERNDDIILFGPEHEARFNALEYERSREGRGSGITENLVSLFEILANTRTAGATSGSGMQEAGFWRAEMLKLIRNAIEILGLANETVSFPNIYRVIQSAPRSKKVLGDPDWQEKSFFYDMLLKATERSEKGEFSPSAQNDYSQSWDYWTEEFPSLSDRTRSVAVSMYTGIGEPFSRGLLRQLFSETTTVVPEDTFAGKIIILDLPQKQFNEMGVFAQVLFKFCWQRAVERRSIVPDSPPVFLWADESQHFVNEHDVGFQTTSRSSRVATVLLTQNLPNYHFALGGNSQAKALVDSLLGNLTTKIFHNNTCVETNLYASRLFGQEYVGTQSQSFNMGGSRTDPSYGSNSQEDLRFTVEPREFTNLFKGGPPNGFIVEGIVHQGGKTFNASQENSLIVQFNQKA